jgi:two-component system, chemotaxis family, chemotaxis protein CheY
MDDDADVRLVLADNLRSAGHTVSLAADGQEGMRKFRADPADLVITDIFMPAKEGLETILELRRLVPNLPIIAISGRPVGSTMLCIARHLGAVATLQKPFSRDELLSAVEQAL